MAPPTLKIDSFVPVIDQLSNAIRLSDDSLVSRRKIELIPAILTFSLSTFVGQSPRLIWKLSVLTLEKLGHSFLRILPLVRKNTQSPPAHTFALLSFITRNLHFFPT